MSEASFNAVNYSLRPSKTIQRALVFEGLSRLQDALDLAKAAYVGFGSIWFTDFVLAHRTLRISRMVSIEANEIGYKRAKFNKPYRFVRIEHGYSFDLLPGILQEVKAASRPLILWLDYDKRLQLDEADEVRNIVENAPDDTVLLVTFDASDKKYGGDRPEKLAELQELFGRTAPDQLERTQQKDLPFGQLMATLTSELILSTAKDVDRECYPAFKIVYRDKATMATVGAILPSKHNAAEVKRRVGAKDWPGLVIEPVAAPHLTQRETSVLQAKLPSARAMSRATVRSLGFDLEEDQIRVFQTFYRHYPMFAQIFA